MYAAIALLMTAIGAEVTSTALIPRTDSFHNLGWSALVLAGYGLSTFLLSVVVKTLPLGATYAVWAGLGTTAVALIGYLQGEPMSPFKAASIGFIVLGVVSLQLASA